MYFNAVLMLFCVFTKFLKLIFQKKIVMSGLYALCTITYQHTQRKSLERINSEKHSYDNDARAAYENDKVFSSKVLSEHLKFPQN